MTCLDAEELENRGDMCGLVRVQELEDECDSCGFSSVGQDKIWFITLGS